MHNFVQSIVKLLKGAIPEVRGFFTYERVLKLLQFFSFQFDFVDLSV